MMDNNSLLDVHITNYLEHDNENHPVSQANEANEANETNETNRERIFEENAFRDLWHPDTRLTFLRRVQFYAFGTLQVDLKNITKCQNAFIYSLIALPLPSDIF
ncbi:unnamed protein product [Rhizophagus irregularis]|nr:unnamed protein product [Rhizophagus irregularis]